MPEGVTAVASYFAGDAAAATATTALTDAAVSSVVPSAASAVAGASAATAGLKVLGSAVGTAAVGKLMAPSAPNLPPVQAMPDPLAQEQARKQALTEQLARRGRASTIMTAPSDGGGKLGG